MTWQPKVLELGLAGVMASAGVYRKSGKICPISMLFWLHRGWLISPLLLQSWTIFALSRCRTKSICPFHHGTPKHHTTCHTSELSTCCSTDSRYNDPLQTFCIIVYPWCSFKMDIAVSGNICSTFCNGDSLIISYCHNTLILIQFVEKFILFFCSWCVNSKSTLSLHIRREK